jgi:hypothetical protein
MSFCDLRIYNSKSFIVHGNYTRWKAGLTSCLNGYQGDKAHWGKKDYVREGTSGVYRRKIYWKECRRGHEYRQFVPIDPI